MQQRKQRLGTVILAGITVAVLCVVCQYPVPAPLNIGSPSQQIPAAVNHQPHAPPAFRTTEDRTADVFVFLSPECPISNSYLPKLNRLARQHASHGIHVYGVIPAVYATDDEVTRFRTQFKITFPLLLDRQDQIGKQLQATHTPQVVVRANSETVYSGRIDNRYTDLGKARQVATQHDLADVLQDLAAGGTVPPTRTPPIGCLIHRLSSGAPGAAAVTESVSEPINFSRHVAPVIYEHCSRCHRPGEAAPFALLTCEDMRDHAAQIEVVVRRGLMPPWKAEPGFGEFANEHRLTARERDVLCHWIASDQAAGDPGDLPLKPLFSTGWQLGKPDVEFVMPEPFDVPADGPDIYQHFVIPTELRKSRLVNAVEFRPGAPEVVHHAFTYFDTTGRGRELDAEDPAPGYSRLGSPGFAVSGSLGGWGPGGLPRRLPRGMGRGLPPESDLILQIHYHPIGRPVQDQSRVGLYFAPESATHAVTEIMVANVNLAIPAGESRHHHHAEYVLPVDTIVFDATPHMHVLGREIKAIAYRPDGSREPLLWIRDWNFSWQENYVYAKALRLPKGTRIELDCWFDNSSDNPLNPHTPPQAVCWGDDSTDEMAICYFQVTTETLAEFNELNRDAMQYFSDLWDEYQRQKQARQTHAAATSTSMALDSVAPEARPIDASSAASAAH